LHSGPSDRFRDPFQSALFRKRTFEEMPGTPTDAPTPKRPKSILKTSPSPMHQHATEAVLSDKQQAHAAVVQRLTDGLTKVCALMKARNAGGIATMMGGECDREWAEVTESACRDALFGEEELRRIHAEGRRLSFSSVAPKKNVRFSSELHTEKLF